MSLSSSNRIKSQYIDEIKEKGKLLQNPNFGVCVLKRKDDGLPRFGFVISTKVSKGSVHRNRINRALQEGVRRNVYRAPKGYDFLFLAKRILDKKLTEEIVREVEIFFANLKLEND